ncbi:carboxy-lyase isoform X1 [Zea mays]|uniref:cytokinin riboside 5'-monophosphate phosphoribohydrolase n=1 Tax=Zea mays TaxID=4577 RepID=C4JAR1_MAIZE|nr:carboxy-lyase isoform X1 [Zea mays]ACR38261.1 unknown [Zea mays]ONM40888.1 Cytokinin riboside 5'-monophosphate phosphoribohydrolase LOG7 [Zea mays]|eukprot:XP_008672903.1 carboxy-lyase isoform X1 [Zea mays]
MAMDAAVAVKSGGGGAGSTGVTAAASQSPQAATNGGERRSRFQRICVYCGSAKGRKPSYQDAAVELGKELGHPEILDAQRGHWRACWGSKGRLRHAREEGRDGPLRRCLHSVTWYALCSMHCREGFGHTVGKKGFRVFDTRSLGLSAGGYGTLEELLEVITWAQLGIHKKPVGLLNVDGFYDPLLSFIDMAVNEGFIKEDARRIVISAPTAKELVLKLEEYVPEYEVGLVWEDQMPPSAAAAHGFAPELVEPGITSSS